MPTWLLPDKLRTGRSSSVDVRYLQDQALYLCVPFAFSAIHCNFYRSCTVASVTSLTLDQTFLSRAGHHMQSPLETEKLPGEMSVH